MHSKTNTILIVDDNPEDILVFKRYIKRSNFNDNNVDILEAGTVSQAIKIISSQEVDCVLLDYKLPDKSGNELLKELRQHKKFIPPIIMLTGHRKIELAIEVLKLGAEDYLVKDEITQERLCKIMKNAIEKGDLRKQLCQKKIEIKKLAFYDPLTGLPNKVNFEGAMKKLVDDNIAFYLILLDIDRFKNINDTLGHDIGDLVIRQISIRMKDFLSKETLLFRLGGDEFALLIKNNSKALDISEFMLLFLNLFHSPFLLEHFTLSVKPSIGVANYPDAGNSPIELMKNADIAMFNSKENGGNRFTYYTSEIDKIAREKVQIEDELRKCINNKSIKVVFQPIINLDDESLFAVESLIRFDNKFLSKQSLDKVIQIAEQASLMIDIGRIFMELALANYAQTLEDTKKTFNLSINLSGRQLECKNIKHDILRLCKKYSINPNQLIFELTESAFINNMERAKYLLQTFVELGSQIYLDDFGTGFSSLSLIQQLPLSGLKIDKSFVINMENNPKNAKLVNSIIVLALANGLAVTAEGVETLAELNMLKIHPNVKAQGFYISKPINSRKLSVYQ